MWRLISNLAAITLGAFFLIVPAHARPPSPLAIGVYTAQAPDVAPDAIQAAVAAVQVQLNRDFRQYYRQRQPIILVINPPTPTRWSVYVKQTALWKFREWVDGYHWRDARGPFAVITTYQCQLSSIMSHEVLEMLADPSATGREIVDGTGEYYQIDGEQVSDFRLPRGQGDFCSTDAMLGTCY